MPRKSDLQIFLDAFNEPPEKAVEFLREKGFEFSWSWTDVKAEAHATAFTVAKAARMDILTSIRQMVQRAIGDGLTLNEFRRSLEVYLKLAGWWGRTWEQDSDGRLLDKNGQPFPIDANGEALIPDNATPPLLGSPSRLRTIYQTNVQSALMAGRYAGMMQAVELRPYWQYIAVGDSHTTALCASLHLKVFPADDPFWKKFYPPNHWGCRSRVRSLSEDEIASRGLPISSSKGLLGEEDVVVRPATGETMTASTIKVGDRIIRNDPAFNFNPGEQAWKPDLSKYPKDLVVAYKKLKS
jgi:SPP1 gp7 family putative phage head morphogenesis protein